MEAQSSNASFVDHRCLACGQIATHTMTWQVVVRVTGAIAATACLLAMYDALYMYNRSLTNAELNRPRGEVIEPSRGELEALARKLGKSGSLWPHACKPDGLLMQLAMRIGIGSQVGVGCLANARCSHWLHQRRLPTDGMSSVASRDRHCARQHIMHTFWRGPPNHHLEVMVRSFACTQTCAVLYVWCHPQSACDAYKQWKVPSVVEFRLWDAVEESKGSPFEDAEDCPGNNFAFSHNPTGQSSATIGYTDYVRIVVLYRYGGLWVDGDVIMLRDMRPLLQREFAYQWGSTQNINTAIFHLKKGSKLSEALAQESARNQCRFHPFEVRQYVVNAGLQDELLVYVGLDPCTFFVALVRVVISFRVSPLARRLSPDQVFSCAVCLPFVWVLLQVSCRLFRSSLAACH